MDTLEDLNRKLGGAREIKSVVKAMKAMAASNIMQYEMAVGALGDYYHTVELGVKAYLTAEKIRAVTDGQEAKPDGKVSCVIVFGSDLGLVGQFNDLIADFTAQFIRSLKGKTEIWVVGERVQALITDMDFAIKRFYSVPAAMEGITPLIRNILIDINKAREQDNIRDFYVFHNKPRPGSGYDPVMQKLLPLDEKWMHDLAAPQWPGKNIPEVIGNGVTTLLALINEYLFASVFKACAESLAAENASRLSAMLRAEKNIGDLLQSLGKKFQSLRQSLIDEELFDVVSGFEALKDSRLHQVKAVKS